MARRRKKRDGVLPEIAEPDAGVPRRLRVEGQLRQHVSTALSQMGDPRLADISLTRVQMTDDLQLARIFVRVSITGEQSEHTRRSLLRGLRSAAGRLRAQIGQRLALRYTPELRFLYDDGPDAAARVDELLDEIRRESSSSDSDTESDSDS